MKCKHPNIKEIYKRVPRFNQEAVIHAKICESCNRVIKCSVNLVEKISIKTSRKRKKRQNKNLKEIEKPVKEIQEVTLVEDPIDKKSPKGKKSDKKNKAVTKKTSSKKSKPNKEESTLTGIVKNLYGEEETTPLKRSKGLKMMEAYSDYFEDNLTEGEVFVKT